MACWWDFGGHQPGHVRRRFDGVFRFQRHPDENTPLVPADQRHRRPNHKEGLKSHLCGPVQIAPIGHDLKLKGRPGWSGQHHLGRQAPLQGTCGAPLAAWPGPASRESNRHHGPATSATWPSGTEHPRDAANLDERVTGGGMASSTAGNRPFSSIRSQKVHVPA